MSEFSESFHLRTVDKNEGKKLLKSIGSRGIVFEQTNGWVTVIPEGELNSKISSMSSYSGTIMHYMFAEDHAWMTSMFFDGCTISSYVCAWDPELYIEDDGLNIEELSRYLVSPDLLPKLKGLFSIKDIEEIFDTSPAYKFAKLIGLEHYEWLAGQDIPSHGNEILESNSGAELINV